MQRSSPGYHQAFSTYELHSRAEMAMRLVLNAASRVKRCEHFRCLSLRKRLAPAPTCTSLVYPVPFPAPHQRHASSSLPCPDLWTALEIAATIRKCGTLSLCASLCLPADTITDTRMIRIRFHLLAKLLHPDRWLLTWAAAQKSVPAAWVELLGQPPRAAGNTVGESPVNSCRKPAYAQWT